MSQGLLFSVAENVINPLEAGLASLGIDSAFKAGVLTAVVAAGIFWTVKPSSAFDSQGRPKEWILLDGEEGAGEKTYVPWYIGSVLIGYGVNLII